MIKKEILKKIKQIEIKTKYLVNTILQGEYLSTFKGRGIEFTEVREYVEGDDVRTIDWNVTARMNFPYVKTFIEERELQVIFATDLSGSLNFGTEKSLKKDLMVEFVASLAFTANINNDRVGLLGFSSIVEKYIPPKKGKKHILKIIRELLYNESKNLNTNISEAIIYLSHILKKRSTIFLISDFYDEKNIYDSLKIIKHSHDVIPVILRDKKDYEILNIGYIPFYDSETKKVLWIDTNDKENVKKFKELSENYDKKLEKMFKTLGIDYLKIYCGEDYINSLISFFEKRNKRLSK